MADSLGNRGSDDESVLPILGSLLESVGICHFSEKQMQPSAPPPEGSFARWLVVRQRPGRVRWSQSHMVPQHGTDTPVQCCALREPDPTTAQGSGSCFTCEATEAQRS